MTPSGSGSGSGATSAPAGQPLAGLTFLNTREVGAAAELSGRLERLGARVIERPTIAFVPPRDWTPFDTMLATLAAGDWLAFSSATAVRCVLERLEALGRFPDALAVAQVASVGKATAGALEAAGIPVALVPPAFQGEALLEALRERLPRGTRVWMPRAEVAREVVAEGLREAGMVAEVVPVYRTVVPEEGLGDALGPLQRGGLDWLVFTSSSTVTNFLGLLPAEARAALDGHWPRVACLGAITARTAREAGLPVDAQPAQQDLDGLVAAIAAAVAAHDAGS